MMDRKDHKADMGHKYRYAKKRKTKRINTWELFMISAIPAPVNPICCIKGKEIKREDTIKSKAFNDWRKYRRQIIKWRAQRFLKTWVNCIRIKSMEVKNECNSSKKV